MTIRPFKVYSRACGLWPVYKNQSVYHLYSKSAAEYSVHQCQVVEVDLHINHPQEGGQHEENDDDDADDEGEDDGDDKGMDSPLEFCDPPLTSTLRSRICFAVSTSVSSGGSNQPPTVTT